MSFFSTFMKTNEFLFSSELKTSLHLTEAEMRVYSAATQLGEATMQDLARVSGIKRSTIYTFIDELKARQLITETRRNKTRLYSATPLRRFIALEEERLTAARQHIPQFELIAQATPAKPQVTYFSGRDGIRQVFSTLIEVGQPVYSIENLELFADIMGSDYETNFVNKRVAHRIPLKAIVYDAPYNRKYFSQNVEKLRDCRFVAAGNLPGEMLIFGNYVALFSYVRNSAYAVLIHDAPTAKAMQTIWQALWNKL